MNKDNRIVSTLPTFIPDYAIENSDPIIFSIFNDMKELQKLCYS